MVISRTGYQKVPAAQAMAVILATTVVCGFAPGRSLTGAGAALAYPLQDPSILPLLAFTGLFAAAIPSILFLTGIRLIGGTRAGILMLFEPVVGVALAALAARRAARPDPGRRRAGHPRCGAHPPALGGTRRTGGRGVRRRGRRGRGRRPAGEAAPEPGQGHDPEPRAVRAPGGS